VEDLEVSTAGGEAREPLRGRSVLVTGAYGLLGSWLVKALLEHGARVVALRRDEPPVSALEVMKLDLRIDVVHGDVTSDGLVARVINEYEIDSVFHLAAQTVVGNAGRAPVPTLETNVRGTWLVMEACRLHGVERVLVASSDKVYGPRDDLPYRESHPLLARYPYDVSKAAADLIARSYWHTFGLPVAVTRFANLYGGGDTNHSRLVPESVCAALAGRRPVIRSDGSPERDFLYVEDAVRAYLAIWEALGRGEAGGEAFNGGGGQPHRVADVVGLICRLAETDAQPDIRGEGTPPNELDRQWVDSTKLRELTGWEPTVGLEEGLRRTIEWYRAHPAAWAARAPGP
jgi:CDP-glucose 4,6-dehydratase